MNLKKQLEDKKKNNIFVTKNEFGYCLRCWSSQNRIGQYLTPYEENGEKDYFRAGFVPFSKAVNCLDLSQEFYSYEGGVELILDENSSFDISANEREIFTKVFDILKRESIKISKLERALEEISVQAKRTLEE